MSIVFRSVKYLLFEIRFLVLIPETLENFPKTPLFIQVIKDLQGSSHVSEKALTAALHSSSDFKLYLMNVSVIWFHFILIFTSLHRIQKNLI